MSDLDKDGIAATPRPPYVAVIFTSLLASSEGYGATAARMDELVRTQPGFLGVESAHDGLGITVSYWTSTEAARAWKEVGEHLGAQLMGREVWYSDYRVRVATVERDYGPPS